MKKDTIVDEYLDRIDEELSGLASKLRKSVIEELKDHIAEKSEDLARKSGKEVPDEKILGNVIEDLGKPRDVASEYIKTLPKNPDIGIKAFLSLQFLVGIFSVAIGIDQIYFGVRWLQISSYETMLLIGETLIGVLFLALGLMIFFMVLAQVKKPSYIQDYGSYSVVLSLVAGIGGLTVLLKFVLWRHLEEGLHETTFYALLCPILIALVIGYVLGLEHTQKFQRLLATEIIEEKKLRDRIRKRRKVVAISAVILIFLLSISGVFMYTYSYGMRREDQLLDTELIGGKYNATIEHWHTYDYDQWHDYYKIVYHLNGTEVDGAFDPKDRPILDWLKENTSENAVIMSWWDYGHEIRGYANREPVIDYPSESILDTIAEVAQGKPYDRPFCSEEKVRDVATALTGENSSEIRSIMNKYNASYIVTINRDPVIAYAFYKAIGKDPLVYIQYPERNQPTAEGEKAFVFKVWSGKQIDGFELVYSDIISRVYKPVS